MIGTKHSETALGRLIDEREGIHRKQESKLAEINLRDSPLPTPDERDLLARYKGELADFDSQILATSESLEADIKAEEESRKVRRALSNGPGGFEADENGAGYRDFYTYAREKVLAFTSLGNTFATEDERQGMALRQEILKRTPANTLSGNVGGLLPPQHINEIFQVINKTRPIINTARRYNLDRGQLTYPVVTTRPVVAVQGTEKTEAGNTGMVIDMVTANASTYLGGGDISWQALNWSTPDALQMWFDLAAEDYARKTEADAAQVLLHSGFLYNIATTLGATPTFAEVMTAVGAAYTEVFTNSRRLPDTFYASPDRYGYLLGLTSTALAQFTKVSEDKIGPYEIVVSPELDAGTIVVGARAGLLVAETPGAPVELKVVEPAIGGLEVGIIGAFEAVVADPGAFALATTAS